MLLGKLISFECLDANNTDELKKKLYNFFFNWSKDPSSEDPTINHDDDFTSRNGKGTYSDD